MNFYAASVAQLWTMAMRCGQLDSPSIRRLPNNDVDFDMLREARTHERIQPDEAEFLQRKLTP